MSIDLAVHTSECLSIERLIERTPRWAQRLTGFESPPVTVEKLEDGQRAAFYGGFATTHGESFILSWRDCDDGVLLIVSDGNPLEDTALTFSVGATRSPTEYVLALAASLAAAELLSSSVVDTALFWSEKETVSSVDVGRLFEGGANFRDACERAVRRRDAL